MPDKTEQVAYNRQYREQNNEQLRQYDRDRYKDPARKAQKATSRARTRGTKQTYDARNYATNKEAIKARVSRLQRLAHSGWTAEEFNEQLARQENRCFLCGEPLVVGSKKRDAACADHCHRTGKKRKILCRPCNAALGCFRDDPALLRLAATYLEEHK